MRWLFVGEALVLRKARRILAFLVLKSTHAVLRVAPPRPPNPDPRTVAQPHPGSPFFVFFAYFVVFNPFWQSFLVYLVYFVVSSPHWQSLKTNRRIWAVEKK